MMCHRYHLFTPYSASKSRYVFSAFCATREARPIVILFRPLLLLESLTSLSGSPILAIDNLRVLVRMCGAKHRQPCQASLFVNISYLHSIVDNSGFSCLDCVFYS